MVRTFAWVVSRNCASSGAIVIAWKRAPLPRTAMSRLPWWRSRQRALICSARSCLMSWSLVRTPAGIADSPKNFAAYRLAVDPPDNPVVHLDTDPVGIQQLHLSGQQPGAGAVNDQPVGVPSHQQRLQGGIQEVGQRPAGRGYPQDRRQLREGIAVTVPVDSQGQGRDAPGD